MSLWAVAEWDYTGSQEDELSMKRGDIIQILDRSHEEWWEGDLHGNAGVFPANRCRLLTDKEVASVFSHEVMNPFRSQNNSPAVPALNSKPVSTTTNTATVLQQLEEAQHVEDEYQQQLQQHQQQGQPSATLPHQRVASPTRITSTDEGMFHFEEIRAPTASRPGSIVPNSIEFLEQPDDLVLPVNWTAILDGQGERYFYNVITNETSWDPPEGTIFTKEESQAERNTASTDGTTAALDIPTPHQGATFSVILADPLPTGWSSTQDEDGQEYFFNEITGETTWDRPLSTSATIAKNEEHSAPDHIQDSDETPKHTIKDDHKRASTVPPTTPRNVPKRQSSADEHMLQSQILNLSLTESELRMLQLDQIPREMIERRGPLRVKTQKTLSNATISSWKDYYVVVYQGFILLYRDDNGLIKQACASMSGGAGGKGSNTGGGSGGGGSGSNSSLAPPQQQQKQASTSSNSTNHNNGNSKHANALRVKPSGCFDADKLVVELSTKEKSLTKKKNCFCITAMGSHVRLLLQETSSVDAKQWIHDIQASLTKRKAGESAGLEESQLMQLLRRQTSGASDGSSSSQHFKMNKKIEESDQKMADKDSKEKEKDRSSRTSGIRSMVAHGIPRRRSTQDERLKLPSEDLIQLHQQQQQQQLQNPGSPTSPQHHHGQEEENEGLFGRPLLPKRKDSRDRASQRMSSSGLLSSFMNNSSTGHTPNPQHGSQELIPEEQQSRHQLHHQQQQQQPQHDHHPRQKSPGPQGVLSPQTTSVSSTGNSPSNGVSAAQNAKAKLSNMSRNFFSSKDKDKDKEKEKDKHRDHHRDKDREKEKLNHPKDDHDNNTSHKKEKKDDKEKDFRKKMKEKVKAKMDKDRKDKMTKKTTKTLTPTSSAVGGSGIGHNSGIPTVFGGYLTVEPNQTIPRVVELCITAIEKRGLSTPGIYRVSGHMGSIQNLKRAFNDGLDIEKMMANEGDINTIAALLKLYFRELKEPLMMFELYSQFITAADITDYNEKLYFIKELVHSLPEPNFSTLQYLMMHLGRVQDHYQYTKMDSANLAICFAPNLLRQEVDDLTSIINTGKQSSIVDTLIEQREWIFDPYPPDDEEEEGTGGEDAEVGSSGSLIQGHEQSPPSPKDEYHMQEGMEAYHSTHAQNNNHQQHQRQYSNVQVEYGFKEEKASRSDDDHERSAANEVEEWRYPAVPARYYGLPQSLSPPPLPLRHSPSGPFSDSHREDAEEVVFYHPHGHRLQAPHGFQQHTLVPRVQYTYNEDEEFVNDDGDVVADNASDEDGDGRAMLRDTAHGHQVHAATPTSAVAPPQLPARHA